MSKDLFSERSFKWRVKIRPDREHRLKSHFYKGTMLYELVGILDKLAAREVLEGSGFRFVFAGREKLLAMCSKGCREDKASYTMDWLKKALAELRARRIIGPYFTDAAGRDGMVVAPHEALCHREGEYCVMYAPRRPERFECTDEEAAARRAAMPEYGGFDPLDGRISPGRVPDVSRTAPGPVPDGQTPPIAPPVTPPATPPVGAITPPLTPPTTPPSCEIYSPSGSPIESAQVAASTVVADDAFASGSQNGAPNRVSGQPGEENREAVDVGVGLAERPRARATPTPASSSLCTTDQNLPDQDRAHDARPTAKQRTIREHFADRIPALADYDTVIDIVSDGNFTDEDVIAIERTHGFDRWKDLADCCRAAIVDHGAGFYLGLKTHGDVMAWAMALFTKRHGDKVPPNWYACAKTLRATTPEMAFNSVSARSTNALAGMDYMSPNEWQRAHGYEFCADGIFRAESDRLAQGFRVKNAKGTWVQE